MTSAAGSIVTTVLGTEEDCRESLCSSPSCLIRSDEGDPDLRLTAPAIDEADGHSHVDERSGYVSSSSIFRVRTSSVARSMILVLLR